MGRKEKDITETYYEDELQQRRQRIEDIGRRNQRLTEQMKESRARMERKREWLLKDLEAIEHPTEEQLVRMREYRRVIGKRRRRISRKNARKAKRDRRRARGDANYVSTDSDEEFVDLVRPTDDSSSEATSESDSEGSSAPANSGASGASVANAIETC